MLNTIGDIRDEVLVRLNASTTVAFYTDAILNDWVNQAYRWAAAMHKWPFTERRDNLTAWSSGTEDYAYPTDFKSDSIRILQVGTERLQKTNFDDYQIYREENSTGSDKIFSDLGRRYYINPFIDASGTITVWGQFTPAQLDFTDTPTTTTTVFSNAEEEGNEAVVLEIMNYAKLRENKVNEALLHHQRAQEVLEGIWQRIKDEQFSYQTKNRSIFKRINVLEGAIDDELLKRDQFY